MEIEKKYQIKELPQNLNSYEKKEIEQGYLSALGPIVRIRKSNEDYILTYKSNKGFNNEDLSNSSVAIICNEVELPLSKESYYHLRDKTDYNIINKTRYMIPLNHDLIAELDVFHGKLEGLVFAEVEFADENSAHNFTPPNWFAMDVSFDKKYRNYNLAKMNSVEEFVWNKFSYML